MMEQQNTAVAPTARIDDLVITEAGDEVLVYDKQRHQIHHLNRTSAAIWRLCDGTRSGSALVSAAASKLDGDVNSDTVELALAKLAEANLLTQATAGGANGIAYSRRKVLRRAVVAGAIAVPAVISITAPSAAAAACSQSVFECRSRGVGSGCSVSCCCPPGTINAAVCVKGATPTADVCTCAAACAKLT